MLRRRREARRPRNTPVPAIEAPTPQAGIPRAIHAEIQHEPRRRSRKPAGYANGTYLPRSRRSGFGSRQSMFRVT